MLKRPRAKVNNRTRHLVTWSKNWVPGQEGMRTLIRGCWIRIRGSIMLLWYTEKGEGRDYLPPHHCFTFSCEVETPFPTTRRLGKVAGLRGYWTDEPPGSDVSALTTSPTHRWRAKISSVPDLQLQRLSSRHLSPFADVSSAAPSTHSMQYVRTRSTQGGWWGRGFGWRERETFHACAGLFCFISVWRHTSTLMFLCCCWASSAELCAQGASLFRQLSSALHCSHWRAG